jgi:Protein of unknown function (DUF551)
MSEWIDVRIKLPNNSRDVLGLLAEGRCEVIHRNHGLWFTFGGYSAAVTHWIPIPEPPARWK